MLAVEHDDGALAAHCPLEVLGDGILQRVGLAGAGTGNHPMVRAAGGEGDLGGGSQPLNRGFLVAERFEEIEWKLGWVERLLGEGGEAAVSPPTMLVRRNSKLSGVPSIRAWFERTKQTRGLTPILRRMHSERLNFGAVPSGARQAAFCRWQMRSDTPMITNMLYGSTFRDMRLPHEAPLPDSGATQGITTDSTDSTSFRNGS
jgi:hypothetical protein